MVLRQALEGKEMKSGKSAHKADDELYESATKEAFNICLAWLYAQHQETLALRLVAYLEAITSDGPVDLPTFKPGETDKKDIYDD